MSVSRMKLQTVVHEIVTILSCLKYCLLVQQFQLWTWIFLLLSFDNQASSFSQDATFLEACIENHTKTNLYMDQVEFEASQHWTATILRADDHCSENDPLTR